MPETIEIPTHIRLGLIVVCLEVMALITTFLVAYFAGDLGRAAAALVVAFALTGCVVHSLAQLGAFGA